jgi:hypothetical protein
LIWGGAAGHVWPKIWAKKGVRKVANFLLQIFALLFSYTIFKQFCNILATQNKNYY